MRRHGLVQIRDISGMMFVVMDLHGVRVNVRLQRVVSVRQRRQCERAGGRGGSRRRRRAGLGLGRQRAGRQGGGGEDGFLNGFSSCHHNESFRLSFREQTAV